MIRPIERSQVPPMSWMVGSSFPEFRKPIATSSIADSWRDPTCNGPGVSRQRRDFHGNPRPSACAKPPMSLIPAPPLRRGGLAQPFTRHRQLVEHFLRHGLEETADLVRFMKTSLGSELQPVGNVVVQRTMGLAMGHAALAAPSGLLPGRGGGTSCIDLAESARRSSAVRFSGMSFPIETNLSIDVPAIAFLAFQGAFMRPSLQRGGDHVMTIDPLWSNVRQDAQL